MLLATSPAGAQQSGELILSLGAAHMRALDADAAITTRVEPSPGTVLLGIPESFDSPGVEIAPRPTNTLMLAAAYAVTDRFVLQLDLGVPPEVRVHGRGVAREPGASGEVFQLDLADPAINPLGQQRQWSPVLAAQYRFGTSESALRPFLSAGVTYTWFTRVRLNPAFERSIDERFGQFLAAGAGRPGRTQAHIELAPFWGPVFGAGARLALSERWGVTASAAYASLRIEADLTMTAADGSRLSRTHTRLDVDGLVTTLGIDYTIGR